MFSNRSDLLPQELIVELQKLQDEVPADGINVREKIIKELNIDPEAYFTEIGDKPLAAASISQVFRATLKTGESVILKIKRDNILDIIESDLVMMRSLVRQLEKKKPETRRIKLPSILDTFEKAIHIELSLQNEWNNIERFRKHFANNGNICVPETYPKLSNNNILCMDYIDGLKVTDMDSLLRAGLDIKKVARQGTDLFMTQVLDHGFFHADPHAGNIFVLPDGRIAFIDFGTMVGLMPSDRKNLENIIVCIILNNPEMLVPAFKKIAVDYSVQNEDKLRRDIFELFEMVGASSLASLDLTRIFSQLRTLLLENDVTLPEYLYQLMRGLIHMEGIGKKLDPEINLVELLKPYYEKILKNRYSPKTLAEKGFDTIKSLTDSITHLPVETLDIIHKIKNNEIKIIHEFPEMREVKVAISKTIDRLVLAVIISALSIGSAILVMSDLAPRIYGIPVLGFLGFLISAILGISISISMLRGK